MRWKRKKESGDVNDSETCPYLSASSSTATWAQFHTFMQQHCFLNSVIKSSNHSTSSVGILKYDSSSKTLATQAAKIVHSNRPYGKHISVPYLIQRSTKRHPSRLLSKPNHTTHHDKSNPINSANPRLPSSMHGYKMH